MKILIDFDVFSSPLFDNLTGSRVSNAYPDTLRKAVQSAANVWSSFLKNDFPELLENTQIRLVNPSDPYSLLLPNPPFPPIPFGAPNFIDFELPREVDDIIIYVSTSNGIGVNNNAATFPGEIIPNRKDIDVEYLSARKNGINYLPSVASISFNSDRNWRANSINIGGNDIDIFLTALHEIGHVLGFDKNISSLQRYINSSNVFSGTQISRGFDSDRAHLLPAGGNIPFSPQAGTANQGFFPIMDTGGGFTSQSQITWVDLQILNEIGYEISPNASISPVPTPLFAKSGDTYSFLVPTNWNSSDAPIYNGIIGGTKFNDSITGNTENEFFAGGPGDDTLSGGVGNDSLYGGQGNDSLLGGPGDDLVYGGVGDDKLFSGGGRNVLTGAGQDTNGKYGFNEKDTLVRSAFSLRTTFVIGDSTNGNFYNNVDGFSSTNPTSDFDKDFAFIQGYTPGQDRIQVNFVNPISGSGYRAETFNGDTWIFDSSTSDLIAKVQGTSKEQITFIAFA
jgi:hypothetical protein